MAGSTVYLALAFLVVGALAAPKEEVNSIEDLENGYFYSNTRIIGGEPVPEGEWRWKCGLSTGLIVRSFLCGCSVLTERHLMTAAHCIDAVYRSRLITGGSLLRSLRADLGTIRWNSGGTRFEIADNRTHPNYLFEKTKNDLGLLITTTRIQFSDTLQPASLNYDHIEGGKSCEVAGFGRTSAGGPISHQLLRVYLNTIDGGECAKLVAAFAAQNNIWAPPVEPHIEFCTLHSVGRGTCNGDSGSAMVKRGTNQQVGIVSWGFPCAIGAPDMFVRISAYKAWIEAALSEHI